ncbi:phospholipase D family protein [Desulfococcaceae bacterium HSG9]|nr:phospholipase D family protein [Desulfococcaceae bacterium HSG9]
MAFTQCKCGFLKRGISDKHIGKKVKCPICGESILIRKKDSPGKIEKRKKQPKKMPKSTCPKCGYERKHGNEPCPKCRIIDKKRIKKHIAPNSKCKVKFLDTTGVSYYLQQLINNANERLVLISPFLKVNERIKQSLQDKERLQIDIRIIYGKKKLQPEEIHWLKPLQSIRTSFCKNLHAKCYLNEKEAIITSMNLYDFSQINNNEMGIYIPKKDVPDLYKDVYDEAMRLIRLSDEIKFQSKKNRKKEIDNNISKKDAFCIRCKKTIILNQSQPYCTKCFKVWNRYKNNNYKESHCHICGKANQSSINKPICYSCIKHQ